MVGPVTLTTGPLAAEARASSAGPADAIFRLSERLRSTRELRDPFAQHAVAYAAQRAVAQGISAVPFLIHTGRDEEHEDILRDGEWVRLFDDPNPLLQSRAAFWELIVLHLLSARGECVLVKEGADGEPVAPDEVPAELWPLSGRHFEPIINEASGLPVKWIYRSPDDAKDVLLYDPHELVFHKFVNPADPLRGMGPTTPAHLPLATDWEAQRYTHRFFINDATPGGLLVSKKPLTPEQHDRIMDQWKDRHEGVDRRRRVGVLEGGLEYQETGTTQRDMEFEKLRTMSRAEILMTYGTTELDVGLTTDLNFATAKVIERRLVTKTLLPIMRLLEDGLWAQLFRPVTGDSGSPGRAAHDLAGRLRRAACAGRPNYRNPRRYVTVAELTARDEHAKTGVDTWGEFDLTTLDALRENFTELLASAKDLFAMGVPLNEINARLDLGLEPQPHGDIGFLPAGVTPVDQLLEPPDDEPLTQPAAPNAPDEDEKPDEPEPEETGDDEDEEPRAAVRRALVKAFLARRSAKTEKLWSKQLRRLVPLEAGFQRKFARWLRELAKHQLRLVARRGDRGRAAEERAPSDKLRPEEVQRVLFQTAEWARRLETLSHPLYVQASNVGLESAFQELGGNFAFDVVDPRVVDVIARRERVLVSAADTIRKRMARTIERGVANGETIHEVQERIRADFRGFSGPRALTVARTEMAGTVNSARHLAFQAEGVEEHQWITARDEAVRDSHAAQDGDTVPVGTPFANGLLYPNDPSGPPEETINCRCVTVAVGGGRAARNPDDALGRLAAALRGETS